MSQINDIFKPPNDRFHGYFSSIGEKTESTNYENSFKSFLDNVTQYANRIDPMILQHNIYTGEHFPVHSYIMNKYKFFPSKLHILSVKSSKNLLEYFISKGFKVIFQKLETLNIDFDLKKNIYNIDVDTEHSENVIQSLILENSELQCCVDMYISVISSLKKDYYVDKHILSNIHSVFNIEIYYDYNNIDNINKFVNNLNKVIRKSSEPKKVDDKSYIYLLNESDYGLDITPHEIKKIDLDITKFYNDDFVNVHNLLFNKLKEDGISGIAFLHGEHGTGKTTYLRYLTYLLKVKCIFIPRDLLNLLATPGFITFLKNYPNSVLILEDCGEVIKTINKSSIVPNLLNYSDGILGDILKCKIIVTFNEDVGEIDPRLTRGGRCFINYEFKKLNKEKAQALNSEITEDAKLCDIFNEKVYTNVTKTKVGFK